MHKYFMIAFIVVLVFMSHTAFASSIEVISLIDRQGVNDTSLLIGASEAQISEYIPDGKLHSQILAFYVKVYGHEILFDTGLKGGNITSELIKHGVKPEDVKIILLTHLHPDHFGGLVDADNAPAFPNAEIYIARPEVNYWVDELDNDPVKNVLNLYTKHLHLFEFNDEILDGIRALDASGHTPGHTVFDINSDNEELLIVGDLMHFVEIQLPVPSISVRYDTDPDKARETRRRILDYAAGKNIPIAGMHITPPGIINVRTSGEGYEKF